MMELPQAWLLRAWIATHNLLEERPVPPERQLAELNRTLAFVERDMTGLLLTLGSRNRVEQTVLSRAMMDALIAKSELLSKMHNFDGAVAALKWLHRLEPFLDSAVHEVKRNPRVTLRAAAERAAALGRCTAERAAAADAACNELIEEAERDSAVQQQPREPSAMSKSARKREKQRERERHARAVAKVQAEPAGDAATREIAVRAGGEAAASAKEEDDDQSCRVYSRRYATLEDQMLFCDGGDADGTCGGGGGGGGAPWRCPVAAGTQGALGRGAPGDTDVADEGAPEAARVSEGEGRAVGSAVGSDDGSDVGCALGTGLGSVGSDDGSDVGSDVARARWETMSRVSAEADASAARAAASELRTERDAAVAGLAAAARARDVAEAEAEALRSRVAALEMHSGGGGVRLVKFSALEVRSNLYDDVVLNQHVSLL